MRLECPRQKTGASQGLPAAKEGVNLVSQRSGAFEVGEMATVFESHQAGTGKSLCNVLGSERKEIVVAGDDQRRDVQALELGMQVVALGRGPGLIHQPF